MHRFLVLLTGIVTLGLAAQAEEPFNFDRAPGKLPKDVVPQRYRVSITPSLETLTFTGSVSIDLNVRKPVRRLVLNSLGLKIEEAFLESPEKKSLTPELNEKEQLLTFPLAEELPAGPAKLFIRFSGKLSEAPEGMFITRYSTPDGDKRALMTQFQATDARRMFPCWDEPAFRARFQLTANVPENWLAVSNMPALTTKLEEGHRKTVVFDETPSMVTYLVAFSAGELEVIEDEIDGIKLRAITTAGKREQARYALEVTKQVLPFYNEYFGVKYPLPKLDQLSFASTGASGMENWGAIIYNDLAFLYDPKVSTQHTKERVYEVVAHEIAHQWFGDLVTMGWWDNIWLNEGFASWMATKATDHFNPNWHVSLRSAGDKEYAMQLDARAATHPIQQRIDNEAQAGDSFDQITYQKGQSFIRMLEAWLGEDVFRAGIRAYMKEHAYSNTTTANLWAALTKASGQPVAEIAAGWTEQPGFPLVKVASEGEKLVVNQERFTTSPTALAVLNWRIPVSIGVPGKAQSISTSLLGPDALALSNPGSPVKVNIGDTGYFRVSYSKPLFEELAAKSSDLPEADRLNLLNDTWALVQADRATAAMFLSLVERYASDPSFTIQQTIVDRLFQIDRLARNTDSSPGFHAWVRNFLRPQLSRIGWDSKPGESPLVAPLRAAIIGLLTEADDSEVIAEASRRFTQFEKEPATLVGDLRARVLAIAGRTADRTTFERLHQLARKETSTEQKQFLYDALAATGDPGLATAVLDLSLTDELVPKAATSLVLRVGEQHPQLAWNFAKAHLDTLLGKLSTIRANDYVPNIFRKFTDTAHADELEAFANSSLPPDAIPMVKRAAEEIRHNAALKSRILPEIDTWCPKQVAP